MRRNVAGHHASRADDASRADGHAFQNDDAEPEPDAVFDYDGGVFSRTGIIGMPVGVADDRICTAADTVSEADAHRSGDARSGESAFVADFQHGAGFQGRQDAGRGNSDQIGGRRGIENAVFPDFNPAARQTVKH